MIHRHMFASYRSALLMCFFLNFLFEICYEDPWIRPDRIETRFLGKRNSYFARIHDFIIEILTSRLIFRFRIFEIKNMQLLHIVLLHMVYNRQKNAKKSFCHSCREIMKIRAEKLCNFRKIVQFRRPPVRCRQCSQGRIERVEKNLLQVGKRQSFTRRETQSQQIVRQSRRNPRVNQYRAPESPNKSNRLRFHSLQNLAQVQVQVVFMVPQGGSNISRSSHSGYTSLSSRYLYF